MGDFLTHSDFASVPLSFPTLLISILLSFAIGQVIAWVYMKTHTGLSYSRSFVNSLIIIPIIVALVMGVMANNLVTAFGMMAVFSIVRFRNILRDTFDSAYVLWALSMGMACGTQRFPIAIIGCTVIALVIIYLRITNFGNRLNHDFILNLHWQRPVVELPSLQRMLERHAMTADCVSQRSHEGHNGTDLSYRLMLRDPSRVEDMMTELRALPGVARVTGLKAEAESEV